MESNCKKKIVKGSFQLSVIKPKYTVLSDYSWLPVTLTLSNSNLPLIQSECFFPSGRFLYNLTFDDSNSWQLEPFTISFESSSYQESTELWLIKLGKNNAINQSQLKPNKCNSWHHAQENTRE